MRLGAPYWDDMGQGVVTWIHWEWWGLVWI